MMSPLEYYGETRLGSLLLHCCQANNAYNVVMPISGRRLNNTSIRTPEK